MCLWRLNLQNIEAWMCFALTAWTSVKPTYLWTLVNLHAAPVNSVADMRPQSTIESLEHSDKSWQKLNLEILAAPAGMIDVTMQVSWANAKAEMCRGIHGFEGCWLKTKHWNRTLFTRPRAGVRLLHGGLEQKPTENRQADFWRGNSVGIHRLDVGCDLTASWASPPWAARSNQSQPQRSPKWRDTEGSYRIFQVTFSAHQAEILSNYAKPMSKIQRLQTRHGSPFGMMKSCTGLANK